MHSIYILRAYIYIYTTSPLSEISVLYHDLLGPIGKECFQCPFFWAASCQKHWQQFKLNFFNIHIDLVLNGHHRQSIHPFASFHRSHIMFQPSHCAKRLSFLLLMDNVHIIFIWVLAFEKSNRFYMLGLLQLFWGQFWGSQVDHFDSHMSNSCCMDVGLGRSSS